MAISVISISSDSSEDSVGTPAGRVILFGTIPTTIPDTTPVITPPATQTDTPVIPTETPIIAPTIPPSPDYTPASLDYSPASDSESDPSSDHIPPLPDISPFLSSDDDPTDSDTPDTPSSPTHDTPFTEITASTQRSPIIPHLPGTSTGPSRKRCRFPMTSLPALSPVSGALSPVRADLIPSPKRVRDSGYLADVEVDPREISLRDDAIIDKCNAYVDALRDRGIEARVVVEADDRDETETGMRGPVEVRVERVTHPVMPEDIPEPAQEGAVEVTYETLGDLVQRFHDHTQAIPRGITGGLEAPCDASIFDRVRLGDLRRVLEAMGQPSLEMLLVYAAFERKMPNTRSGASMTPEEFEELVTRRVAEEKEAREATRTLEPLNENRDEQEGENGGFAETAGFAAIIFP
ncbi:hypothetical protein Tco_0261500 [Tanacetum coccineum]